MPKKRGWGDEPISLHGVPFDEALSGILVVKPPECAPEEPKKTAKKTAKKGKGGRKTTALKD